MSKTNTTPLGDKMIEIANRDNLPDNHPMRIYAKEFNDTVLKNKDDFRPMLSAWAKARKTYCNYTGEPLVP